MRKSARSRWRGLAVGATALSLVLILAGIGITLRIGGLTPAANVAQLVSVLLTLPAVAVPVVLWWRGSPIPQAPLTEERIVRAKETLAGQVADQWKAEAALWSLDDPDPMPVQWRLSGRNELMDHPGNIAFGGILFFAGSSNQPNELAQQFRALRRRRLVIIGGPGAGKTTLAVQLLRELIISRQRSEPVPVLLPVVEWDTAAFPRLYDWLAVRLSQDYPALQGSEFGADAPRSLAARGHILPVLDGLDELPETLRAAMIEALNRSMGDDDQLIITSRTQEYFEATKAAGDVLTSAAVVEPQPMTPDGVANYLQSCVPQMKMTEWEEVITSLRMDVVGGTQTPLAETIVKPLYLWLLRIVYLAPGADPKTLLDSNQFSSPATLQAHLFDRLVPALIASRPPSKGSSEPFRPSRLYDPARVQEWMCVLAELLTRGNRLADIGSFAWWRLNISTRAYVTYTVGRKPTEWFHEWPGFADTRIRGRLVILAQKVMHRLAMAAIVVPLIILFILLPALGRLAHGLPFTLGHVGVIAVAIVMLGGIVHTMAGGFSDWIETPTSIRQASTPLSTWRADRALNIIRIAAFMISGGIVFGLTLGIQFGPVLGLVAGIVCSLACGFTWGLNSGNHHAWLSYLRAARRMAKHDHMPRRLMSFLDDAHRLGLLRAVGPFYQFRHAELQAYLADVRIGQIALQGGVTKTEMLEWREQLRIKSDHESTT